MLDVFPSYDASCLHPTKPLSSPKMHIIRDQENSPSQKISYDLRVDCRANPKTSQGLRFHSFFRSTVQKSFAEIRPNFILDRKDRKNSDKQPSHYKDQPLNTLDLEECDFVREYQNLLEKQREQARRKEIQRRKAAQKRIETADKTYKPARIHILNNKPKMVQFQSTNRFMTRTQLNDSLCQTLRTQPVNLMECSVSSQSQHSKAIREGCKKSISHSFNLSQINQMSQTRRSKLKQEIYKSLNRAIENKVKNFKEKGFIQKTYQPYQKDLSKEFEDNLRLASPLKNRKNNSASVNLRV